MTVSETSDTLQRAQQKMRLVSETRHSLVTEVAELRPALHGTAEVPCATFCLRIAVGESLVSAFDVSETVVTEPRALHSYGIIVS